MPLTSAPNQAAASLCRLIVRLFCCHSRGREGRGVRGAAVLPGYGAAPSTPSGEDAAPQRARERWSGGSGGREGWSGGSGGSDGALYPDVLRHASSASPG